MDTIKIVGNPLYQWELGRKVQIFPLPNMTIDEVHFSNHGDPEALVVKPKDENGMIVAEIPNILLQSGTALIVYSVNVAEGFTDNLRSCTFNVRKRAKPSDYVYTEVEILNYETLEKRIRKLEESGVSDEQIAKAVAKYLAENPVESLTEEELASAIEAYFVKNPIEGGTITDEQIAQAVEDYFAEHPIESPKVDLTGVVKSVNGNTPDENGNVEITIPDSGGNVELDTTLTQSGKAADAKAVGDKIAEITGISLVEPAEDDMPKVFITGVKPTTKDDVLAEMQYNSKTDKFHAYLEIKCQGTSSMSWAKKNFTVKLYSDETRETKLKKDFKHWNHASNKFVLKANYIDHSHARNIVSARLWGEVVASRPDYNSLPVEMRNSPNNGAVDGFPIKVYYNGNYEGVYTWNIGKDDWMWGMDKDNPNHVLLCAEGNTDGVYKETASNFRKLWDGVDGSKPGWSVEVGTNSTALKNSLNNLIQFVMDNDGDDFRNGIGNYLDIQSAIDYYIFQYEICGLDGLAHNMLLATYDGALWRCGAYDMDSTFGLWWDGSKFVPATYACPEDYQERYSLLWERIEANFLPELKARQAELRKTVLSYSNMVTHFERFMDIIGLDLYAEDLTIYTGIPSGSTNNIKQIRNYVRDRQVYVDAEFAKMNGEPTEPEQPDEPEPSEVPCTGISLDKNELAFDGNGTQTITAIVTPDGCTDAVTWESNNTSVATVNGGVVTAVANGSAVITAKCGMYFASCSVTVSGNNAIAVTLISGKGIDNKTGEVVEASDGKATEEYIEVDGITRIDVHSDSATWISYACYDENKQYISGDSYAISTAMYTPENTKYIRFAVYNASANTAVIYINEPSVYEVNWSSEPTGKITNTGEVQETGGDAYLCDRTALYIPARTLYFQNVGSGRFIWKEVALYDSQGVFISKYNGDKGEEVTTVVAIPQNAVYFQATAFPNNIATNNDPANQVMICSV